LYYLLYPRILYSSVKKYLIFTYLIPTTKHKRTKDQSGCPLMIIFQTFKVSETWVVLFINELDYPSFENLESHRINSQSIMAKV